MATLTHKHRTAKTNSGSPGGHQRPSWVISLLSVLLFLFSIWLTQQAARIGQARFLSVVGVASNELASSDQAVRLGPGDPENHYDRARVLMNSDRTAEAVSEFRIATALRKHDFYLWLEYGLALDQIGQEQEALSAFETSVHLAPHFAEPRWQFGNLLFRLGRIDEAFGEFREAVNADHSRLKSVIDLAFAAAKGDAAEVQRMVQPQTSIDHLRLADFFSVHGEADYAVRQFDSVGPIDDAQKKAQFKQLIIHLIESRNFEQAHVIWAKGYNVSPHGKPRSDITEINGDFEEPIDRDVIGFGWQVSPEGPNFNISLDGTTARTGTRSILIDFRGGNDPGSPVIFQTVLVQPGRRYSLTFSAKTQNIITGGPPVVRVYDIDAKDRKMLVSSDPIQATVSDWKDYSVEFKTGEAAKAILITMERRPCTSPPCPIFGQLWFDNFSLASEP
jgi:tetratricopeptide (TPR) repeat protein